MKFSTNQLLLYKLFISYPNRSFYMQEIGRILMKKPGVFQRTLNNLERDGFVQSSFQANARFFSLNPDYPFLKEITSILKKSNSEINDFKKTIQKLDAAKKKSSLARKKKIVKKSSPPRKSLRLDTPPPVQNLKELQSSEIASRLIPPSEEKPLSPLPTPTQEEPEKPNPFTPGQLELF